MTNRSDTQVFMRVPEVRKMARRFSDISKVLTNVAKVLDALTITLKTTAFIGLVGGFAVAQFIDQIRPPIKQLAEKCEQFNKHLVAAAAAFERGDAEGATYFH